MFAYNQILKHKIKFISNIFAGDLPGSNIHGSIPFWLLAFEWTIWDVDWLAQRALWKGLSGIVRIESKRTIDGEPSIERRHYICRLGGKDSRHSLSLTRGHWGVENRIHRSLDVKGLARRKTYPPRISHCF
jgi:hypothetical protein